MSHCYLATLFFISFSRSMSKMCGYTLLRIVCSHQTEKGENFNAWVVNVVYMFEGDNEVMKYF